MHCISFLWRSRHALLRSQLKQEKEKHQSLLSFSLISTKEDPLARAHKQVVIPVCQCTWVGVGGLGGCILIFTHLLLLTNCLASCNSCIDSDMSSKMMPKPTLVTPWTVGAACVAMIRLIAFISSYSLRLCA